MHVIANRTDNCAKEKLTWQAPELIILTVDDTAGGIIDVNESSTGLLAS